MKTGKQHLTLFDLITMEVLLQEGYSIPHIALKVGKNKTTIYRCYENNINPDGIFRAESAWKKIQERRSLASRSSSHIRILSDSLLEHFILEKIQLYWSPEQIAGRWKELHQEPLSHETVYEYIRSHHGELVTLYFRRKGKPYRNRKQEQSSEKYQIPNRRMIDERPMLHPQCEGRQEVGHWEGDTIIGKDHQGAIVTNVERKSGMLLMKKVERRTAESIFDATTDLFETVPYTLKISLTYDNGKEFTWHSLLEQTTNITIYFAHPYSPWERGSNENTNGLIRQFIPKGTNLSTISDEQILHYQDLLNNRPRKRLNYKTPYEVWQEELESCIGH